MGRPTRGRLGRSRDDIEASEELAENVAAEAGGAGAESLAPPAESGGQVKGKVLAEFASATAVEAALETTVEDEWSFVDAWHGEYSSATTEALLRNRIDAQELGQEVVIGRDDRVRITDVNKTPYKWICSLVIRAGNGKGYIGTGWLAGPRTVITAGHCVYMRKQGGWASRVTVHIARNDGTAYASFDVPRANLRSTGGWVNQGRPEADYAALILPQSVPSNYAWLPFEARTNDYLRNRQVFVIGYPGDKDPGQLWGHGRVLKQANAETLVYDIDTYGGQSGASVLEYHGGDKFTVVGIHNYGDLSGNSATRITGEVKQTLAGWCA